jgi:CheY-like chemotaxis protein
LIRVLVVEDGEGLMRLLVWSLREAGLEASVTTPEDISRKLAEERPDAVVLNLRMDAATRRQTLDSIRQGGHAIAVVDLAPTTEPAEEGGPDLYVPAPYRAPAIVEAITSLLPE